MKVRMKQQITGTRDGELWPAVGETLVVSDGEGADLCRNGYAEPVAAAPAEKRETAAAKPAEKRAASKKARK